MRKDTERKEPTLKRVVARALLAQSIKIGLILLVRKAMQRSVQQRLAAAELRGEPLSPEVLRALENLGRQVKAREAEATA